MTNYSQQIEEILNSAANTFTNMEGIYVGKDAFFKKECKEEIEKMLKLIASAQREERERIFEEMRKIESKNKLANWLKKNGKYKEAEVEYRGIPKKYFRIKDIGTNHVSVGNIRGGPPKGLYVTVMPNGSMICKKCGTKVVNTTRWKTKHLKECKIPLTKLQSPYSK